MATDLELLERWRGGEKLAGAELFERHFDALYRFVSTKLHEGADDLVQRAFLACLEGRDRLRDGSTFRSYLYGSARYLMYEQWRARASVDVDFNESVAHDFGPTPSSVLERKSEERLLLEALRRIPVEFQMAIELYYLEDLKSREVADVLDIPHATIRSRVRRGLEQLRRELAALEASTEALSSTMTRIEDWARKLHE